MGARNEVQKAASAAASKRYRQRHPDRTRLTKSKWRLKYPDLEAAQRARGLLSAMERRHIERIEKMGRAMPDHCELCGQKPTGFGCRKNMTLCFDHDHTTGTARGWLCDRCNKTLGLSGDDTELLRKMIAYLEQN